MSGIFLFPEGGGLVPMAEAPYDAEDVLQQLLADYPALLTGDRNDGEEKRWLLVCRESGVPDEMAGAARWSLDHLFLDESGVPTLVEVKRSTDTRIRREVVGQMLDYAANAVVYWPLEKIRAEFEATHRNAEGGPDAVLSAHLATDGGDPEAFWQQVRTNLQAGRIRMMFVADVIPPELARIVEFLNTQMDPAEVLALEARQHVGEGARTLLVHTIGQTEAAVQRKRLEGGRQWDEQSFFEALARRGGNDAGVARKLLKWAQSSGLRIWWGRGAKQGSCFPMLDVDGDPHWTFALWTYGAVEMQFQMMATKAPFSELPLRQDLLARLRQCQLPGVSFPDDCITRRPSFPLSALSDEATLRRFLDVMDWYLDQVREKA
jgi:hypothetical protein